jgi:hypothetical protein
LDRSTSIEILAHHEAARLSPDERAAMLLDWWTIGPEDPEHAALPDEVRAQLAATDGPVDALDPLLEPLLVLAIRRSFVGTVNAYIEARLALVGRADRVTGQVETLEACPCCRYRSLERRGDYEICRACFWEDDGTDDADRYSGPNHMTLAEGRAGYRRCGAVEEAFVEHVSEWAGRFAKDGGG